MAEIGTPRVTKLELSDGRTLAVHTRTGSGTPIVLLHGLLDSGAGWHDLCAMTRRPCFAFDLPGFGDSDLPTRPSFNAYAEDIVEGIEQIVDGSFLLVGHSLGGGVAAAVAERVPERVAALVLLAPAGFGRIRLAEAISMPGVRNATQLGLPFALGSRSAVSLAYRTFVSNGLAPTDEILDRVVTRSGRLVPGAREATKAVVRAGLSKRGFRHRVLDYDGPAVAIWGDRDRLVPPAHVTGVLAALPQAEAHVWSGMGHHHQRERLHELVEVLDSLAPKQPAKPARAAGPARRVRPVRTARRAAAA